MIVVFHEPEVLKAVVDARVSEIDTVELEFHLGGPEKVQKAGIDLGRTALYADAVDSYMEYALNHPTAPELFARARQKAKESTGAETLWEMLSKPAEPGITNSNTTIFVADRRIERLAGLALLHDRGLFKGIFVDAMTHYLLQQAG